MIKDIVRKWNHFLFNPIGTEAISLYRIFFGALVLANLLDISTKFSTWYCSNGLISAQDVSLSRWNGAPRFDLFVLCPTDQACNAYFWTIVIAAACLCLGLCTRFSAGYVSMGLISLYHHNPFISNGGDTFLRLISIFMVFAPAGEHYSIDAKLRKQTQPLTEMSPWAQRMMQIQLAIAYWGAFWFKVNGPLWWKGSAFYYASRLPELMNGPLPLADQLWFCKLISWLTIIVELLAWTLIWFRPCRYYVLAVLAVLHFSIAYLFLLPYFQCLFISTLLLFIEPVDIKGYLHKATKLLHSATG